MPGTWNNNSAYALYHTQCPCLSARLPRGFSGGGMDDRFDLWLTSYQHAGRRGPRPGARRATAPTATTALTTTTTSTATASTTPSGSRSRPRCATPRTTCPVLIAIQVPAKVRRPRRSTSAGRSPWRARRPQTLTVAERGDRAGRRADVLARRHPSAHGAGRHASTPRRSRRERAHASRMDRDVRGLHQRHGDDHARRSPTPPARACW